MNERKSSLLELLERRIAVLDGATGTALAERGLGAADYGGDDLVGCHEALVIHRPDVVEDLHAAYLAAGADMVETDTFGATPVVLAEYGLENRCEEINRRAAEIARAACADATDKDGRPRFVVGSMGPTTKALTLTGGITFDELSAGYARQVEGLAAGGVDVLLVETAQDPLNLKAALIACRNVAPQLPLAVSATIEPTGTTLGGQTVEAVAVMVEPWQPVWVGINCSTGPGPMTEHVRALAALTPSLVAVVPNAGIPDGEGRYLETPDALAAAMERFAAAGWLNVVGGCCGTTVEHVRRLRAVADRHAPRRAPAYDPARLAGGEVVEIVQQPPPLLVGERTNVLGSRAFRRLVAEERWAEAAEVGRRQVRGRAGVLDVCLADAEGDEHDSMAKAVTALRRVVRVPLMVDTTDPDVMAAALKLLPGRPVLNSVNLEDGGARLDRVAALAVRYGAAVVAGCIDEHPEEGMARTAARKVDVARRLLECLERAGLRRREILVDPLVFPAATGDPKFQGSAAETIEGIRRIKEELPDALTVAGISNVSFGLPAAGREALNAVFLHHCVQAGLDAAIVNTEQLVRYPSLAGDEVRLAEAVLFDGGRDAVDAFAARFRARRKAPDSDPLLPAEERLRLAVIEGTRTGLEASVDELLLRMAPLDIINGPLMAGMDEVGRLFGAGELIVAEVLVSAEVMKAAVDRLRPHMKGDESASRGSILLATVRGDVHDIGKNLVGIVLSTNGFEVRDLGVQCPSQRIVEAFAERPAELVGLSGLLVRSAHQMAATAADLSAAGIAVPLLVGGAALSASFTRDRIAPAYDGLVRYAADAMAGLAEARKAVDRTPIHPGSEADSRQLTADSSPTRPGEAVDRAPAPPRGEAYSQQLTADSSPTRPGEAVERAPAPPRGEADSRQLTADGSPTHPGEAVDRAPAPPRGEADSRQLTADGSPTRPGEAVDRAPTPPRQARAAGRTPAEAGGRPPERLEIPAPPDLARHVLAELPLDEVFDHLNLQMLLGKHLGVRGSVRRLLEHGDVRTSRLLERVEDLQDAAVGRGWLRAAAVYRFVTAHADGDTVVVLDSGGSPCARLPYPRQQRPPHASAADWVHPDPAAGDTVAAFVVTAGAGVSARAAELRRQGRMLDSVALQVLALETAEAGAEWLHRRLRELWGFPDPPELSMQERFRARYRGIRLSFGYPACPDLEPQADLFRLLQPEEIGVRLTEGYMMDPEASVSAVVFHHPDARYLA